jgi:hypothetical protein
MPVSRSIVGDADKRDNEEYCREEQQDAEHDSAADLLQVLAVKSRFLDHFGEPSRAGRLLRRIVIGFFACTRQFRLDGEALAQALHFAGRERLIEPAEQQRSAARRLCG